jgi:hypothetical protein
MIKFTFSFVIVDAASFDMVISLPVSDRYLGTVLPRKSENSKGVPHELQLQDILVFCPNFNPNVFVPAVERQSPIPEINEKLIFPPIVNGELILYP